MNSRSFSGLRVAGNVVYELIRGITGGKLWVAKKRLESLKYIFWDENYEGIGCGYLDPFGGRPSRYVLLTKKVLNYLSRDSARVKFRISGNGLYIFDINYRLVVK